MEALAQAQAAVEALQAEAARQVKVDRINATVDRQLAALQPQIDRLLARKATLEKRRIGPAVQEQAPEQQPQEQPQEQPSGDKKRWQTANYTFWRAYRAEYKGVKATRTHLQADMTRAADALGIDRTVPSKANTQQVYEFLMAGK
jgi:hypothetical protein